MEACEPNRSEDNPSLSLEGETAPFVLFDPRDDADLPGLLLLDEAGDDDMTGRSACPFPRLEDLVDLSDGGDVASGTGVFRADRVDGEETSGIGVFLDDRLPPLLLDPCEDIFLLNQ